MRGFFITGSDTGVGKTHVTAALARHLLAQGRTVSVSKPVATGAEREGNRWVSDDTHQLASVTGQSLDDVTPFVFAEPLAPAVAAQRAGRKITLIALAEAVRQAARGEIHLVEGVGGLLCPLTEHETVADLATLLSLPLLIVVRRSLGTLNHALLTVEAAERRGLRIAGLIVNETTAPQGVAEETNVAELRRRLTVPILAVLPHVSGSEVERTNEILESVDWFSLLR